MIISCCLLVACCNLGKMFHKTLNFIVCLDQDFNFNAFLSTKGLCSLFTLDFWLISLKVIMFVCLLIKLLPMFLEKGKQQ